MWVPLIENNEQNTGGADFFIKKYIGELLAKGKDIDTILLACTHYPLIRNKIQDHLSSATTIVSQGEIVARSLVDYLKRHPDIEKKCSKNGTRLFFTTDSTSDFNQHASIFYDESVESTHIDL